jgi:hypothetical protein
MGRTILSFRIALAMGESVVEGPFANPLANPRRKFLMRDDP